MAISSTEWTRSAPLPGGDIEGADFARFQRKMSQRFPWISEPVLSRLLQAYGTRVENIIGSANNMTGLGRDFGCGLTEAELMYLRDHEFALNGEDVLWRRSKLGLHLSQTEQESVLLWFDR